MKPSNVVITGSTRGIGLAFTEKFLQLGDKVVISSRNKNLVDRITQILSKKYPNQVFGTTADVTKYEELERLGNFAVEKLGEIDIWINNAGVSTVVEHLCDIEPQKIARTINTNILGTLYGTRVAIKLMKGNKKGGKIYNMEGFGSQGRIRKGMMIYGATKRTIPYLRKAIALENKHTNIIIGSIQPGMTLTNLLTGQPGTQHEKNVYWVFNILSETPENVAAKMVPLMKSNKKTNKSLQYRSSFCSTLRFFTPWRFKNRFFDEEGKLKIQKIEDRILQSE